MTQLVIVESPAKAQTIAKFLAKDFEVVSSIGHIRDMPKKGSGFREKGSYEPIYEIPKEKQKIVRELTKKAKAADCIWLATDEDREGEAIAWHLSEALHLDPARTKRITFHEITKSAIQAAVASPRNIDMHLVKAQQARRVLDRLVGFGLSPLLWRKVSGARSAGRVQSPTMRLVVERERAIRAFTPVKSYKGQAEFCGTEESMLFSATLIHDCKTQSAFQGVLDTIPSDIFSVADSKKTRGKKSPPPPFVTASLQQEAGNRYGFPVAKTMRVAQDLYRRGFITYMRTDSVNMAETALTTIAAHVRDTFGAEYVKTRRYHSKSKNAQEAHEAIRPTDCAVQEIDGSHDEQRIYRLIYERTVASQMADAKIDKTEITIEGTHSTWQVKGQTVVFDGFLRVYSSRQEKDVLLPSLSIGDAVHLQTMSARESFSKPKGRYSEATLVRQLEELGIGRPSTFATMVSTVQDRGYVEKRNTEGDTREYVVWTLQDGCIVQSTAHEVFGAEKNKLFPTDMAMIVCDFLTAHFVNIMQYDFTADIEDTLDRIARGEVAWHAMIQDFDNNFQTHLTEAAEQSREAIAKARQLGTDPESGKPVSARMGRYGPFVQIGDKDDEEKPRFASLLKDQSIDTITIDAAMELFRLPREVGIYKDGNPVKANIGRFGPYLEYGTRKFVSLGKHDPYTIDLATATTLIAAKEKADSERVIQTFTDSDIQVLNGRYGPYITNGKKRGKGQVNVTVKKAFPEKDPEKLTLAECETALTARAKSPRRAQRKT